MNIQMDRRAERGRRAEWQKGKKGRKAEKGRKTDKAEKADKVPIPMSKNFVLGGVGPLAPAHYGRSRPVWSLRMMGKLLVPIISRVCLLCTPEE